MKKILAIGLALILSMGMTSCIDSDYEKDHTQNGSEQTSVIVLPNEPAHYKPAGK